MDKLQWRQMSAQITWFVCLLTVWSVVCSGWPKHIKAPRRWLTVRKIHRWLMDSTHKWPVMWKAFQYIDVIMVLIFYKIVTSWGRLWNIGLIQFRFSNCVTTRKIRKPLTLEFIFGNIENIFVSIIISILSSSKHPLWKKNTHTP